MTVNLFNELLKQVENAKLRVAFTNDFQAIIYLSIRGLIDSNAAGITLSRLQANIQIAVK